MFTLTLTAGRGRTFRQEMTLHEFLNERRSALITRWRDVIVASYPEDTRRFLKKEKDRFSNPVGRTIVQETEALYGGLVAGEDVETLRSNLDSIIRIRAVQDFGPSEAIAFVLQLKDIVRQELGDKAAAGVPTEELQAFDARVDALMLLAVDVYAECRQRLFEIRVNEMNRQYRRLLARAKITAEVQEHP